MPEMDLAFYPFGTVYASNNLKHFIWTSLFNLWALRPEKH